MSTRIRAVLIIVLGLILIIVGVGAGLLLYARINNRTAVQQQVQIVKSPAVVVTHDMSLGDRITDKDVSLSQLPVDAVPRDALTALDAAIGKIIKSDLVQGEMVMKHNVADPTNNNHDLSFILSNDHVLMAFPVTDLMSQNKIIQRGDVIDILATFQENSNTLAANPTTTTSTVTAPPGTTAVAGAQVTTSNYTVDAFQKVSVTALVMSIITDQNGKQTGSNPSSYLLALSPQDALVLKHLKDAENTKFDIVLRSPLSTNQFTLSPVSDRYIAELYGLEIQP